MKSVFFLLTCLLTLSSIGQSTKIIKGRYDQKNNLYLVNNGEYISGTFKNGLAKIVHTTTKKFGVIDKTGKIIIEPDKSAIYWIADQLFFVYQNGKPGVYNLNGIKLIDHKYSWINFMESDSTLIIASQNGKVGAVDLNQKVIVPFKYTNLSTRIYNTLFFYIHDTTTIYKSDGQVIFHGNINFIKYSNGLIQFKDSSKFYFIDSATSQLSMLQPKEYKLISYGHYSNGLMVIEKNGKFGAVNKLGELVVECKYSTLENFENGTAIASRDKYGIIDTAGNEILPFQYNYGIQKPKNGLIAVTNEDDRYSIIDVNGKAILSPIYEFVILNENGAIVYKDSKAGVVNASGEFILPTIYDEIDYYSNGEFYVIFKNKKMGFANKNGQIFIPLAYDDGIPFVDGLAILKKGNKEVFVNMIGQETK